jgi:hypothetical protein
MATHGVTKRRKFEWITAFDKRGYVACALLAVVLALIHFRTDLSASAIAHDEPSAIAHDKRDVLAGSILVPYADDVCHQRLINNATGQIRDGGLVKCEVAMAHNNEVWAGVRKAFQNQ